MPINASSTNDCGSDSKDKICTVRCLTGPAIACEEPVAPAFACGGKPVQITFTVKNTSNAPIPRLTIDETWYGKDNQIVAGGKGFINGLLQPGEIRTIEIQTPYNAKMSSNQYMFSHANGSVKPHSVKVLEDPNAPKKEPAAKNASARKK